jgi:tetratricopeptide (TPR) repeat protein
MVEKYQLMLEKDPQSLVFAPLVDAYRKMGLHEQAAEEGLKGVRLHPQFAGGRIALARVLIERMQWEPAAEQLKEAVKLSPENILAFSLLADCLVKLKRPKEALKAFKMVLFLNPDDEKSIQSVKKLESLTADEFDDDLFQMLPLKTVSEADDLQTIHPINSGDLSSTGGPVRQVDRAISLIDAFIVRNEFQRAQEVLKSSEPYFSEDLDFIKRRKLLSQLSDVEDAPPPPARHPSRAKQKRQEKIESLRILLARISDRTDRFSTR